MLGIIILSEWNIPTSDHAHEVPRGDQAHIGLVWENFLPIPTYAQNYLQANRVGKVPLNFLS